MLMKAIVNVDIFDYWDFKPNSYVVYDTKIREVGDMAMFPFCGWGVDEIIDGKNALLMPGHINVHQHIYSAYARGASIQPYSPKTFTQRLEQLWWRLDASYDLDATYQSARISGIEFLKSGVTTVYDHHASRWIRGSLEQIKYGLTDEIGIRSLLCFETSDRFNVEDCIDENVSFARENHTETCRGMFGMHAALTLSQDTLKKIADARGDIPIHVHVGESLEEELDSLHRFSMRSVERFNYFGLLDDKSLLAHCTNIDQTEAEIISKNKCVTVVNPTANFNSNNGIPDCGLMKNLGIRICIGTDALGSNITKEYQHTYYYMQYKLDDRTGTKFSKQDLLQCIRNAYEYTNVLLGVKLGRIVIGYEADLILIPYRVSTEISADNAFDYVFAGVYPHFFPSFVCIGGETKLRNYQTVFDEQDIFAKSRVAAQRVWNRLKGM